MTRRSAQAGDVTDSVLATLLTPCISQAVCEDGEFRKALDPSCVRLLAVHATRRILIPQRQTMIARANVAMTKVLSQWALIGWPSVVKTVGDSRNTQHPNFSTSTEGKN